MWAKSPPVSRPFLDCHVAPEQQRRDETADEAPGSPVDLLLEQADQDRRALRVPDEDDPAAVVVVREVVPERGANAAVRDQRVRERDLCRMPRVASVIWR